MTETGQIVVIEKDYLLVETIRQSSCESCSAKKACGHGLMNTASSNAASSKNLMKVFRDHKGAENYSVGDSIVIHVPESMLLTGAFIVYMLPLLCLLAGALVASNLWEGDFYAFLGAVAGFAVGFVVIKQHAARSWKKLTFHTVVDNNGLESIRLRGFSSLKG